MDVPLTCRHCEHWMRSGCRLGQPHWPDGTPLTCPEFWRQPGTDDDRPARADQAVRP